MIPLGMPTLIIPCARRMCRVVLETKTCAALRAAVAWMRRLQM